MSDRNAANLFFSKAATLLIVAVFLCLTVLTAVAQPPGGSRGNRGRGWNRDMWDAFRKAHRTAADKEILDLLRHDSVREELKLTDDANDHLRKLGHKLFEELGQVPQDLGSKKTIQRVSELLDKYGADAFEYLGTQIGEDGIRRLEGIYAQSRRWGAATNSRIAQCIGLQGEELKEFRELADSLMEDMRDSVRPEISEIMEDSSLDFSERRSRIERLFSRRTEQIDEKLKNRLTKDQRDKLLGLHGDPFEDLPNWRRPPPGPPSNFGRGGRGDRDNGDRDNGDRRSEGEKKDGSDSCCGKPSESCHFCS